MKIQSKALFVNVFILLLLLIVMWAGQYLSVINQIEFQKEQLYSNARLLLETSQEHTQAKRNTQLSQLSGYLTLSVIDVNGNVIASYEKQPSFQFPLASIASALGLGASKMQANAGSNAVVIMPDFSHLQLSFIRNIAFETMAWLIMLVVSIVWLRGSLHKPLRSSVKELQKLCDKLSHAEKDFQMGSGIASEFRSIGEGLQAIQKGVVERLHQTEEELTQVRKTAYVDHLTGLPNRSQFMLDIPEMLADESGKQFGVMAVVRTTELGKINAAKGYTAGDQFISILVDAVKSVASHFRGSKIYRLNSSDFAIVLHHFSHKECDELGKQLQGRLNEIQRQYELDNTAFIGMAGFAQGMSVGDLLALCDTATGLAQSKEANAWHFQSDLVGTEVLGEQGWRENLEQLTKKTDFTLISQAIQPLKQGKIYSAITPRFTNTNGDELPYRSAYSMAERLQLSTELDKAVIAAILALIKKRGGDEYYGINVSVTSAHDSSFLVWIERMLGKHGKLAQRLTFEVTEQGLQRDLKSSRRFIDVIHRTGAKVTVKQFGLGMTSFKFFKDLKPDYVKIDKSYMDEIEHDRNIQYFLRLIIDIAHRLSVKVIASGVESQEQKYVLEGMFVDGIQGQYIHRAVPISNAE
ncbi:GGDEF domain-containing protein [Corallincola holothuriorum]|uniref:GGDEF domain-containing protein n=1 Tax=Corallincola holothuriorum TaxID=2282215 RepID=A0A368NM70_9GAMM|nr:EAL domain-containing protein [Corallincola holothuriorum]RCU50411.1 GGDEF domain-containing protein [Corallincola holothuriorum]